MVVVDLDGDVVECELNPSSDTATHIELYTAFPEIGGVVHTHSPWAVSFAQAGIDIPSAGTTHGDYFYGNIPVTRKMRVNEIENENEKNTDIEIFETFEKREIDPLQVPAVLVKYHWPLCRGENAKNAVY